MTASRNPLTTPGPASAQHTQATKLRIATPAELQLREKAPSAGRPDANSQVLQ